MNILIADDEFMSRESLFEMFNQNKFGFKQVKKAKDGQEGLNIIENYKPDILITDIVMPKKNGIDLAIKVKEKYPDCEIIFLSGYSDKEYLKSAITLKAASYVEKPISLEELTQVVEQAVAVIHEKNELKRKLQLVNERQLIEAIIKDKLEHNLLSDNRQYSYGTILLVIESKECHKTLEVRREYKDYFEFKNGLICGMRKSEYKYIMMVLYSDKSEKANIYSKIEQILALKGLAICIADSNTGLIGMHKTYLHVTELEPYIFFSGYGKLIKCKLDNYETKDVYSILEGKFALAIQEADTYALRFIAKSLFSMAKEGKMGIESLPIINFYYQLFLQIDKIKKGRSNEPVMPLNKEYFWNFISSVETLGQLNEYFTKTIDDFCLYLEESNSYSRKIIKAKEFIDMNYVNDGLTVVDVARYVDLTPEYLSHIFKKELNQTLNQYISYKRIELSKKLLKETDLPFSIIAKKVGITDASYLTKKFKITVGLTPSEYRRKCEN